MLNAFRIPLSWTDLFKRTASEVQADNCLGLAAQLAYYFFLALFPALLFFVALVSFIPIAGLMDAVSGALARVAPNADVDNLLHDHIVRIAGDKNGGLLTMGMLGTIWSTSAGVTAIIDALNKARPLHVLSFVLVIAGPALAETVAAWARLGGVFEWTWKILQWPVVFGWWPSRRHHFPGPRRTPKVSDWILSSLVIGQAAFLAYVTLRSRFKRFRV